MSSSLATSMIEVQNMSTNNPASCGTELDSESESNSVPMRFVIACLPLGFCFSTSDDTWATKIWDWSGEGWSTVGRWTNFILVADVATRDWMYMSRSGRPGMVMIKIVAENRGSWSIRRWANSTMGTKFPNPGVAMSTTSNLVMAFWVSLNFLLDLAYQLQEYIAFGSRGQWYIYIYIYIVEKIQAFSVACILFLYGSGHRKCRVYFHVKSCKIHPCEGKDTYNKNSIKHFFRNRKVFVSGFLKYETWGTGFFFLIIWFYMKLWLIRHA